MNVSKITLDLTPAEARAVRTMAQFFYANASHRSTHPETCRIADMLIGRL